MTAAERARCADFLGARRGSIHRYARHPGVAGCATRMLLGGKCARARHVKTAFPVGRAMGAVRQLAFVGLQERWADSVCLFHAMLGGAPRKIEFVVAHSRRWRGRDAPLVPAPYDEGRLDGFVDAADEAVYAEAARVFEANLRRFAPGCVT